MNFARTIFSNVDYNSYVLEDFSVFMVRFLFVELGVLGI